MNLDWLEAVFVFACVYAAIEVVLMPVASLRGKEVGGRVVMWLIMLLVILGTGLVLYARQGALVT